MVKLAVDTLPTVPEAPPAAGPDRALDAPPPAPPAPNPDPALDPPPLDPPAKPLPGTACPAAGGDAVTDRGCGQTDGKPDHRTHQHRGRDPSTYSIRQPSPSAELLRPSFMDPAGWGR
jgi:hypothetical protein